MLAWLNKTSIRTRALVAAVLACVATLALGWASLVVYLGGDQRGALFLVREQRYFPPLDLAVLALIPALVIGVAFGLAVGALGGVRMRHMESALRAVEAGDWRTVLPTPPASDYAMVHRAFSSMTRALDELTTSLRHADEQRRRLFADLAHELSTPTASIVAVADALSDPRFADPALHRKLIKALDEESRRLERLILDIRELANLDDPDVVFRFAPVDLADVVRRFSERANVIAGRAELRVDAPANLLIEADAIRIEQVLTNLVGNAHRYTPADGFIRIALRDMPDRVEVAIEDTGPGVRESVLPRLGERLLRVDLSRARATGGAGLGLSIVSAIVHRHHGTLSFENAEAGGLRVTIALPRAQPGGAESLRGQVL